MRKHQRSLRAPQTLEVAPILIDWSANFTTTLSKLRPEVFFSK